MFWLRISEREKEIADLQSKLESLKDAVEHQRKKNNVSRSGSQPGFCFVISPLKCSSESFFESTFDFRFLRLCVAFGERTVLIVSLQSRFLKISEQVSFYT